MKFFKRGLMAAFLASVALSALAEGYRSVRVEFNEGEAVEIQLTEKLTTKFSEQYMTVADGVRIVVKVPRTNVARFTFSEHDAASINEIDASSVAPQISSDRMTFCSLPAGSTVSVTNASGRQVLLASAEGEYILNFNQFTPGVYMVTVNGVTYKVSIR